jgi:biopolymer transport protein ExbD
VRKIYKISILAWLAFLFFVFSCENEPEKLRIRVEPDAIFVDNKKVANTADVEKQDTLLVEGLNHALRNKALENREKNKENYGKIEVQFEPNQSYDMLYKIMATCGFSGAIDISIVSKINGKKYTESVNFPERSNISEPFGKRFEINPNELSLTLSIDKEYFEIWARGRSFPKISTINSMDSAYDELAKILVRIHNRFINSPDVDKVIIIAEDDTKISYVIRAMHIARISGFFKINLAKLAGSVRQTKEDSIRTKEIMAGYRTRRKIIDSLFNLGLDSSSLVKLFIENKVVPIIKGDTSDILNSARFMVRFEENMRERERIYRARLDSIRKEKARRQQEMLANSDHIACKKNRICRRKAYDSIKGYLKYCEDDIFCRMETDSIEDMKLYIKEYENEEQKELNEKRKKLVKPLIFL